MIRTYKLKQLANNEKQLKIISVINEYRKTALTISKFQWKNFFLNKKFNKNLDIKHLQSNLSERYKQTNQYQVVGILQSYLSNIQNKFAQIVYKSTLDSDTKMKLFFINKYQLWFHTSVKLKGEVINKDIIKLARQIMKNLFKKNKKQI